jgi:para-aminobenzoate synthetase component 1
MTGAPKIKAMEIAAKEEKINRGIYSGAIGFIDQKSANFSVVIRTLILQGKKFEFQTGGAITFDSDPEKELEETYSKAKALMKVTRSLLRET